MRGRQANEQTIYRPSTRRTDRFPIFGSPNSFIFQLSTPFWSEQKKSIVFVQSLGWVPSLKAVRATVLAPEPPAQPVFTVTPQVAYHRRAVTEIEVARPAVLRPVGFRHRFASESSQGPVIVEASQRLPHCA